MMFLGYLLSFLIGFFLIDILLYQNKNIPTATKLSLSLGLGLGISGMLTFLSIVVLGNFHPKVTILINILVLYLLVLIFFVRTPKKSFFELRLNKNIAFQYSISIICLLGVVFLIYYNAKQHPFGEWDAWGLWNIKYRFLVLSKTPLKNILQDLSIDTRLDYPFLLPCTNANIYALSSDRISEIPFFTAILLTLSTITVLFSLLKQHIKLWIAALASLLIAVNPYFLFWGTSQYSDILISLYLLSGLALLVEGVSFKDKRITFTAGLFLGLLTFVKNEGLAMTALIIIITFFYTIIKERKISAITKSVFPYFLASTALFSIPTIILKIFLVPNNSATISNPILNMNMLLNLDHLKIVLRSMASEPFKAQWFYIWGLILFMLITGTKKILKTEAIIIYLFLAAYMSVLIIIYMTTSRFDVSWWVKNSMARIYFYLLPSVLFLCYYSIYKRTD